MQEQGRAQKIYWTCAQTIRSESLWKEDGGERESTLTFRAQFLFGPRRQMGFPKHHLVILSIELEVHPEHC